MFPHFNASNEELLAVYRKSMADLNPSYDDWNCNVHPVVKPLEEVEPKPISFLWPGRIPVGKLTLITGTPGVGKSLLIDELAARITTERHWPDQRIAPQARVLLVTNDRGTAGTHSPRLIQAGAVLAHIDCLNTVETEWIPLDQVDRNPLNLTQGIKPLTSLIEKDRTIIAVLIDPLSEFLPMTGPSAELERRKVLCALAELAGQFDIAIICVEASPVVGRTRMDGVRDPETAEPEFEAVWGVVRDPKADHNPRRRLFLPVRNHHGDDRQGLAFEIRVDEESGVPSIEWSDEESTLAYPEAIGRIRAGKRIWSFSQTALAESWLLTYLSEGPKPSVDILSDARKVGLTEKPLRTAMRRVAVKTKQGNGGGWSWTLAEND